MATVQSRFVCQRQGAPGVLSVSLTSDPEGGYAAGEQIEATVRFDRSVTVTGTPQLKLTVGSDTRRASYRGGASEVLRFRYRAAAGEIDTDGVSIPANALTLNGGTIRDSANQDAVLAHGALADDAKHRVDGAKPMLLEAVVDGTVLTLTWDEPMRQPSLQAEREFLVTERPSRGGSPGRSEVVVRGSIMTVTLLKPVVPGQTVFLTVFQLWSPFGEPPTLWDLAGNKAATLLNREVTNVTEEPAYDADADGLIEITTLAQLDAVRHDLDGDGVPASAGADAYRAAFPDAFLETDAQVRCVLQCRGYELTADLDFDTNGSGSPDAGDTYWNGGAGWNPIAPSGSTGFETTFEGNGRTVRNLFIDRPAEPDVGLFGRLRGSSGIRGVGVTQADVTGLRDVGALAGSAWAPVTASYATGRVSGESGVGGLVGQSYSIIKASYATGRVSGTRAVGGLVGSTHGHIINGNYATGRVSGEQRVGGLVGLQHPGGPIRAGYATGRVTGTSAVGGLAGAIDQGRVFYSYWDTLTSGQATGSNGQGQTTTEIQAPTVNTGIYADWENDFWDFGLADEYPVLAVDFDGDGDATWQEFGYQLREGPTLTATGGEGQVALAWTGVDTTHWSASPAVTYTVTREGTSVETVAEGTSDLAFVDSGVTAGATYTYQVAAVVEGGEATRSALVTVTASANPLAQPVISITAGPDPVVEGTAATYTLTRTGGATEALTAAVSVTESAAMLAANPPTSVTFGAGESGATLTVATEDDAVVEAASAVTAAIASGEGYSAAADAGSAQVSVGDNDTATFQLSFDAEAIAEGETTTLTVEIANGVTFAEDQTIKLDFAGGTAAKGTDYTVSAEALALTAGSTAVQATVTVLDDTDPEGLETVAVAARHGETSIGSSSVTIEASDAALPEISIAAGTSPVAEGAAATFTLTRTGPATEALAVAVSVTESAAMLAANPAASVTFGADESSATLTVATDDDAVVEAASAVTAAVASGEGYAAAADAGSAQMTVEDNDAPSWDVSPSAVEIAEGETATLTVSAGTVTFAEAQVLALRTAGTADAGDYTLSPVAPRLAAGAGSVAVSVTAVNDAAEEAVETVRLTVLHGDREAGTATVTIAASDAGTGDARLADLTLSGGELAFRSDVERYAMTVRKDLGSTTVTAKPNDPDTAVEVSPADTDSDPANGHQVRLAEGANAVVVTVVSEDGQATKTYTVQVTRLAADRAEALRRSERDLEDLSGNVPFGLWSEDGTLWSAMWWSVGLVAFDLETHGRLPGRDLAVASDNPSPTGLWSDGTTLWATDYGGAVYAYRLADGGRVPEEDLAATLKAAGNDTPTGLWSDGETLWVADHYDERVYAYRLADKARDEEREFALDEGTRAFGLWSDGTTAWTADLSAGRVAAYRLADGVRDADRDYDTSTVGNEAPVSLWSDGETLWVGDRYDEKLYAYALEAEASADATLASLTLSGVNIGTFDAATADYASSVGPAVASTTVTATPTSADASVTIADSDGSTTDGLRDVSLAVGANTITATVTAADGQTTATYTVTVTREYAALPEISIAAGTSPVTEGAAAAFTLTRTGPTAEALTVAVSVTESAGMLVANPPSSVTFGTGESSATLTAATEDDAVVEAASAVTAAIAGGEGSSAAAAAGAAQVTVEDNDTAAFAVTAAPEAIAEGGSATLTVAISNGVTFAEDQTVALARSGTASAADYAGLPAALTLQAGASSTAAELTASEDREDEEPETVMVAASHGGVAIGSATVTIRSVSHDATLAALSLSGVDIGTFASSQTSYMASVAHGTTGTTVTATATHPRATVSILPGTEVSLAEGANEIAVTVTAEDGKSSQTYTVTVTRAGLPEVSIAGASSPVTEGTAAVFEVTLGAAAPGPLTVALSVAESGSALSGTPPASVSFAQGDASATLSVPTQGDQVVEADSAVTATVTAGAGYTLGTASSATVTVEDDDEAAFTVTATPQAIAEGESATLTVAISNGATFAEDQSVALSVSGTASPADYSGLPAAVTLAAGASAVTAELAAETDQAEEEAETVTVAAAHAGVSIGSATVTIRSVSHDATLAALSLSGVDIGTFASGTTIYTASVAHDISSTTVTAAATHARATVSILPGAEVSLAEGANEIAVTVTAEDGKSTQTYAVTVTRAGLPVVSIVAVASPVSEGERAAFTVSRTGPTTKELTVQASWSYSDRAEVQTIPLLFQAGRSSKTPHVQKHDDKVIREDVTVTLTLEDGEGYTVSAEARSAQVVLEDNDVPEFALSVEPAEIAEGESATVRVAIANGVTFRQAQTISLSVSGTASASDYTGVPATLTLPAYGSQATTATLAAAADREEETDETVTITASHGGAAIGAATVTITNTALVPLTAQFAGVPESHDGTAAFGFELRFSEEPAVSYRTLRDTAFEVAGGTVRRARRLEPPASLRWEITVEPASEADVALALSATTDCDAAAAICTAGGKPLSNRPEATVKGPGSQPAGGFSLAPENSTPAGIWSDGETVWVADIEDARLFAYSPEDGERIPEQDISAGPAPMGLWSDGETLWVAGLGGGLRAHRLADGARLPTRDLAAAANAAPAGVWSDGKTVWVSDWLGDTVQAYRLADGQREAGRDIRLASGNLMPVGLWSDGEILWVADWRELLYAYRLSDGGREPSRDVLAGAADSDPTGLWSGGGTLLSTSWEGSKVRAYRLPALPLSESAPGKGRGGFLPARAASLPAIADPALKTAIGAALGKASGEAVSLEELAGLEALEAREAGIRDLAGLEAAASLKELDLGFNPLADLRPLAALARLESLNLDGAVADLRELAALASVKRLSLRHNGIEDLGPLAGLAALAELDVGDNRIGDLGPLAGLAGLAVLRADRNLIADLWPLAPLSGLEVLDLGANQVRDLQPLAGLARLRMLRLAGNSLAELHPLSRLEGLQDLGLGGNAVEDLHALSGLRGLRRLDLRGNPVRDLRPLRALPSLVWVHVGGSRIEDLAPLDGLPGLTVAGPDDRDSPGTPVRKRP